MADSTPNAQLAAAVCSNDLAAIDAAIAAGADVHAGMPRASSVVLRHLVLTHGADINHVFDELPGAPTLIITGVAPGVLRTALELGANPNATTALGRTALHRAIDTRCFETVTALIEYGADVTIKNAAGQTPYEYALHPNFTNIIDMSLDNIRQLITPSNIQYKMCRFVWMERRLDALEGANRGQTVKSARHVPRQDDAGPAPQ